MAQAKTKSKPKERSRKSLSTARAYVTATFNNTIITITDENGNTVLWGSAGASGFKGARKATPYAATSTVDNLAKKAKELGVTKIELYIKGPGPGRDGAIRAFKSAGLDITMIADVTPIPHNGPRATKRRRA
ncbi:MAG: 30S ribosomal protein S11 [Candidatus Curtissbacteria bacterium]|nr:30S ribosomal protein S11 [Candidatus Curtissbacteria bacterium]